MNPEKLKVVATEIVLTAILVASVVLCAVAIQIDRRTRARIAQADYERDCRLTNHIGNADCALGGAE